MIARRQLLALGLTSHAIAHRLARGRLHPLFRGVYAVGRPTVSHKGMWMAATLACGDGAVVSHASAAALWEVRPPDSALEVSVTAPRAPRPPGITVHRRARVDATDRFGIPVTTIVCTLVDIAAGLPRADLERAVNEADKLDLIDPDALRAALEDAPPRAGNGVLRAVLDRHTFVLTDSELERLFLPIARRVGLPKPLTRQFVNGFRVDFFWPELGLVVEASGLRYHRTAGTQTRDHQRAQLHAAAGLTPVSFTHAQIRYEPRYVEEIIRAVVSRLR